MAQHRCRKNGIAQPVRGDEHYRPYSKWGRAVRTDWSYDKIIENRSSPLSKEVLMDTLPVEKVVSATRVLLEDYRKEEKQNG